MVQEGSTLAAARVLGINQTTVARRIGVLDPAFGLTLFEKSKRGACPSQAALRLLLFAETLATATAALEAKTLVEQLCAAPPICIHAFDHSLIGNVEKVVADFVPENLGEADVAVRLSPAITDDRKVSCKLDETAWT